MNDMDTDPPKPLADNSEASAKNAGKLPALTEPWRPIKNAPKDGRFILLHVPEGLESGVVTIGAYWKRDERAESGRFKAGNWDGWLGMDVDVRSSWCEPTHWMPLPAPPAQGIVTHAGPSGGDVRGLPARWIPDQQDALRFVSTAHHPTPQAQEEEEVKTSQDHVDDMIEPRKVALRQALDDAKTYDKWGAEYLRVGPAHLSAEVCAAIERHLGRRK